MFIWAITYTGLSSPFKQNETCYETPTKGNLKETRENKPFEAPPLTRKGVRFAPKIEAVPPPNNKGDNHNGMRQHSGGTCGFRIIFPLKHFEGGSLQNHFVAFLPSSGLEQPQSPIQLRLSLASRAGKESALVAGMCFGPGSLSESTFVWAFASMPTNPLRPPLGIMMGNGEMMKHVFPEIMKTGNLKTIINGPQRVGI